MKISKIPFYKNPFLINLSFLLLFVYTAVICYFVVNKKITYSSPFVFYFFIFMLFVLVLSILHALISKLRKLRKVDFIKVIPETKIQKNKNISIWIFLIIGLMMLSLDRQTLSKIELLFLPIMILFFLSGLLSRLHTKEELVSIEMYPQKTVFFKERGTFYEFDNNEIEHLTIKNHSIEITYFESKLNKQISFDTNYFKRIDLRLLVENQNLNIDQ